MAHGNKIKKAISTILFLCIALEGYIHFSYLFRNTGWSRYNITMFYEEPKDSLDVVFIGASNVFRYFNPLRAYSQEGFTSYDYATESGLPMLTNAIVDIKRMQNPKVIVVDPRFFISSRWENGLKLGFKNQLGSQDFHLFERMDAAMKYWLFGEKSIREAVSVFLDLPIYHDNRAALSDAAHWKFSNDNRGDHSLNSYNTEKGFLIPDAYECESFSNEISAKFVRGGVPLKSSAEKLYRDFLSYCVEEEISVLLVESPFVFSEQDVLESNTLEKLAKDYGVPFLSMSFILQNTGLDYETDFCDVHHVNILGAEKYTSFLARYLSENYDLPDHRGDEAFSSWDEAWDRYSQIIKPYLSEDEKEQLQTQ